MEWTTVPCPAQRTWSLCFVKATDLSLMPPWLAIWGLYNEANSCVHETPLRSTFDQLLCEAPIIVSSNYAESKDIQSKLSAFLHTLHVWNWTCTSSTVSPASTQLHLYFLSQTLPQINATLRWLIPSRHWARSTCSHSTDLMFPFTSSPCQTSTHPPFNTFCTEIKNYSPVNSGKAITFSIKAIAILVYIYIIYITIHDM